MKRNSWLVLLLGSVTVAALGAACDVNVSADLDDADASPDASRTDSGVPDEDDVDAGDSGAGDSGQDTGTGDSGTADSGTDAGTDSGTDAGTDSGVVDASTDPPDAGPTGPSLTDPLNCGDPAVSSVGLDCLGGACAAGLCQPVTLATGQGSAFRITVDATNVYWTTNTATGAVSTVPIGGGTVTKIATGGSPRDLAVNGTNVYWTSNGTGDNGGLFEADKTATNATGVKLFKGAQTSSIALDATTAYFTYNAAADTKLGAAPFSATDDTQARLVVSTMTGTSPRGIAVDATNVYFTTNAGTTGVEYADKTATNATSTVLTAGAAIALTSDATHLFWIGPNKDIFQIDKAGTNKITLATIANANTLATDGTNVYVLTKTGGILSVVSVGVAGQTPKVLYSGFNSPEGIALDANAIYVAENGGGNIFKVAK